MKKMAKVVFSAGAASISIDVSAAAVNDVTAFCVANYRAADGSALSSVNAVKAMLRNLIVGTLDNVAEWKRRELVNAVPAKTVIPYTEDP